MSVSVMLIGGPADGQLAELEHRMDTTVYVPTGERGSWLTYRRSDHENVARFVGVYTRPAPAEPWKNGRRR